MDDLSRLSLNQMTVQRWSVPEAVEGCARAGIPAVGLWRHKVAEAGLKESARLVKEAGVTVSSLCRGGMFPAATAVGRAARVDDNRRAVDEAAALGTDVLVLVCGGLPDGLQKRDLEAAQDSVESGIEQVVPYAEEAGVKLGIEPLHPAFAADRSVISTLAQATGIAERLDSPHVGVVIDVYHVWWDPELYAQIERAAGRILGFHVNDWPAALAGNPLNARQMMGDGVIGLRRIRESVDAAGYSGPIEVEIFNEDLWQNPGDEVLELTRRRYLDFV